MRAVLVTFYLLRLQRAHLNVPLHFMRPEVHFCILDWRFTVAHQFSRATAASHIFHFH